MTALLHSPGSSAPHGPSVPDEGVERHLSSEACATLFNRIVQMTTGGDTSVVIRSRWRGTTRWVRNAISTSSDRIDHTVTITRIVRGARGMATTNQLDDEALKLAVAMADKSVQRQREDADQDFVSIQRKYLAPDLFKSATYDLLANTRSLAARGAVEPVVTREMLAAGYIEARADVIGVYDTQKLATYYATTTAQFTTTVRAPTGDASGWAGVDHCDWAKIDAKTLSARALEKCLVSQNPVAIEPGRYTTILEPQAVHSLMQIALIKDIFIRLDSERYDTFPYNLRRAPRHGQGTAKFGMQIIDERITVSTDPMEPDAGYLPFDDQGMPYGKVVWIDQGVLRQLPYDFDYALEVLGKNTPQPYTQSYRMSGGTTSIDEMIATTRRGLLVTRFANVNMFHQRSLLSTGTTADGLWLIEGGKISKPAKNLRFNTSPLIAFNFVDQLGVPQRVFSPNAPAIVPPVKIREFPFTSLADAL